MNAGWVYVLVNSSMPDLVKVGKTTRVPLDRAMELSGVTGIATPFIVAFEQYYSDCDIAEDFVHTELERLGLRVSNNREFFRARVNQVVRILLRAPGLTTEEPNIGESEKLEVTDDDFLPDEFSIQPWSELFERAEDCYYGLGNTIQDYRDALGLYKNACSLGSLAAFQRLGDMYAFGEGVAESNDTAIEYYKEGAKRGNYYCYSDMASIYVLNGQISNASKAWKLFFSQRYDNYRKFLPLKCYSDLPQMSLDVEGHNDYSRTCVKYICFCLENDIAIDLSGFCEDGLERAIDSILSEQLKYYERQSGQFVQTRIRVLHAARKWVARELQNPKLDSQGSTPSIAGSESPTQDSQVSGHPPQADESSSKKAGFLWRFLGLT